MATTEYIHFRLIICPECDHMLCWVNPRLPSYCNECGKHIYLKVRGAITVEDKKAMLKYTISEPVEQKRTIGS